MTFKLTYGTMSNPPQELHDKFELALEDVKQQLGQEYPMIINGEKRFAEGKHQAYSPIDTRMHLATFQKGTAKDADDAVAAAKAAFPQWSAMNWEERVYLVRKFADCISARIFEIGAAISLEVGKNRMEALGDAAEVADLIRWGADMMEQNNGYKRPMGSDPLVGMSSTNESVLKPYGVWVVISPFNFPAALAGGPVGTALVAGNTVVLKPASDCSWTATLLVDCAQEAGIPAGVLNLVTGSGSTLGSALTANQDVAGVTFTGSLEVGMGIYRQFANRKYPHPVILELGGKNPAIVLKDADPAWVIEGLMTGSFLNQGQVCAASSRIYIEAPLFDTLVSGFEQAVKSLSVGPGMSPEAFINPLVSRAHCDKVQAFLDEAKAHNAELIAGNRGPDGKGYYVSPTLVVNPDNHLRLTREEVFGPVVNLVRVDDGEEALQLANDTEYGLTASVWTQNISKALAYTDRLQAGTVWVNSHTLIDANLPFGGMKQSGTGRDFGPDWLDGWCETKSVCVRY